MESYFHDDCSLQWGEFSLFGPNGQVLIKEGGVTFREHVTEYFR